MRAQVKRVAVATIVGLAAGFLVRTLTHRPGGDDPPAAAAIVARNVAARGGLEAWRRVETMAWTGRIESARAPAGGLRFVLEQARPNRTRLRVDALGEESVRVFDGRRGWKLSPSRGRRVAQPYSPLELGFAEAGHGIDGPLLAAAADGSPVTLAGLDDLAGRRAYHLEVHPARGGPEDVWVDAETGLEIRYDRRAQGPGGERRVSVEWGDWRTVEGLQIPFLVTTGGGPGTAADEMKLDSVTLNPQLASSTFEDPAAQRPRRGAGRLAVRAPWPGAHRRGVR